MIPALSVSDTITVLRGRYPDALVCIACGRLLATRRRSSSTLTDAGRLEYTCAECRQARAEAERVRAARLEAARLASQAAADARRERARESVDACHQNSCSGTYPPSDGEALTTPAVYAGIRDGFRLRRSLPSNSKRRGGRPRKHRDDRARWTAAQRARRARQKTRAEAV